MSHTTRFLRCLLLMTVIAALGACDGAPPWDTAGSRQAGETETMAAPPPTAPPTAPETPEIALADFLAAENIAETPVHRDALVDLDDDGRQDLLMYLEDRNWCDAGGCTLLVFRHGERGYDLVARTRPVHPPIGVGQRRHNGWRDLLVGVGGSGTVAGTVALQFDGSDYPGNPALLALLAPDALPPGQTVIE